MWRTLSRILILCGLAILTGCAVSTQVTNTARSSIEQRLLVRSLERALSTLDTQQFKGKIVTVDFYGLTPDKDFAKEFFTAWLQEQRVSTTNDPKDAQLRLKVFASVLGVDQDPDVQSRGVGVQPRPRHGDRQGRTGPRTSGQTDCGG